MPRFDPSSIAKLKAAMRAHSASDGYRLAAAEVPALARDCALTEQQTVKWCDHARERHPDETSMAKFLNETQEKDRNVRIKRCYVAIFGATQELVDAIPSHDNVLHFEYIFCPETCSAEMYLTFKFYTYTIYLDTQLHALCPGGLTVQITTFPNDHGVAAAASLRRIRGLEKRAGYLYAKGGTCPADVARHLHLQQSKCRCSKNGRCERESEMEEYDLVKKQRKMNEALPYEGDTDQEALAVFTAFCNAVWPALIEVHLHATKIREEEQAWMTKLLVCPSTGARSNRFGYVYAAWNPCFKELVKIGATLRDNPYTRLKELSGCNVPEKFELVACVHTKDPFALEKYIHLHFKQIRIQKGDKVCEFFRISKEEISKYFSDLIEAES